jgi:hypothetical protein
MKSMGIIFFAILELAAGIGFLVTPGFSQAPAPNYQQTVSLDGGQLTGGQSNIGPFSLTGQFTAAQTDIELLPAIVNGVQTLNGSSMSQVMTTGNVSSPASASTTATYFMEVDSSASSTVPVDIVGSLLGSVGSAQGEATAAVGLGDAVPAEFDISTGEPDVSLPFDFTATVLTNVPNAIQLSTSVSLSGGLGTVSSKIDPFVQIDPSVPNPDQYKLTFFVSPAPEPTSCAMLIGGLGFLLAVGGGRKFLGLTQRRRVMSRL